MRRTPGWADLALVALWGVAACADASPSTGTAGSGGGVATPRGGSSPDLSAPFVLGTGQIAGGLGNAEVQRTPGGGGGIGGGAGSPGVVVMGGEQPVHYVPAAAAERPPERRAGRTAAAGSGPPTGEQVLQFSRAIDRAQTHVNARRYGPAVSELERAEQIVLNARTPARPYEAALRDLAAARLAAARGDGRTANEAIGALKRRLRAPT